MADLSILKPGLLVSLKSSVTGGVQYTRKDLEAGESPVEGGKQERWETTKVVTDPVEFEAATKARNKSRSLISGVCVETAFGLLCAVADEEKLNAAIAASRQNADEFNETAKTVHVEIFVMRGRIAESDNEATRAIASEMKNILESINDGIAKADVKAIRAASNRAREVGLMLDAESGKKVTAAIEEARTAAKAIAKRVDKGGELAERVIACLSMKSLDEARFAFLELEGGEEDEPIAALPAASSKDLDVDDAEMAASDNGEAPSFQF